MKQTLKGGIYGRKMAVLLMAMIWMIGGISA